MFDSQGRRFEKKVSVAGTITSWERYLYRDYLQIAAFDVSQSGEAVNYALKRIIYWDPAEPVATRPLAIFIANDQIYFPTIDLTKNVCELIDASGTLAATYDYAPFGAVTSTGTVANSLQWSSEHYDSELGLVYYNYRHYSPTDGRFLSRDPIEEQGGWNLYTFVKNHSINFYDSLGGKTKSPGAIDEIDFFSEFYDKTEWFQCACETVTYNYRTISAMLDKEEKPLSQLFITIETVLPLEEYAFGVNSGVCLNIGKSETSFTTGVRSEFVPVLDVKTVNINYTREFENGGYITIGIYGGYVKSDEGAIERFVGGVVQGGWRF